MTQMDPYQRGRRDGIRWAITWLHEEAKKMNDPKAVTVLNNAAFHMGTDISPKVAEDREWAKQRLALNDPLLQKDSK